MRRTIEIQTTGFDEYLQGIGGDPQRGSSFLGLRVPTLAAHPTNRYLFSAAAFSIADSMKARIIGWRQLVTIGAVQGTGDTRRFVEQEVVTPTWRFQDGNVSHHLRTLGAPQRGGVPLQENGPFDRPSFKKGFILGPALLYQTATLAAGAPYTNLTAYTPPNSGRPYGRSLYNGQMAGAIYGLESPWRSGQAWSSLSIDLEGPDVFCWFISVGQTDPSTRVALTPPSGGFVSGGLSPEEAFLQNFPTAVYWRVGASIILETECPEGITLYR